MARHIFQSTLNDQHGNVVVAGKVTVKLSGTSTLATVYESKTGAAITGSVITTGTDGSYLFWVDTADYSTTQAFRLVLETGRGSGTNTLDDIEIFYGGDTPADNVFRIQDNLDRTKQIAFQASGISTGTTRTVTMPDKDITLGESTALGTNNILTNAKTISENITFAGTENGVTTSPVTVANTYTVVVSNGSRWVIL